MESILMLSQELLLAVAAITSGWFGEPTPPAPHPVVVASQDANAARPASFVWSGRTRDASGAWTSEPSSPTFARDVRRELAALRVQVEVDRKLEGTAVRLNELWARATRRDAPERKDLLVEILLARVALARTLNDAALGTPRALPSAADAGRLEMVAASATDLGLAVEVENDPRVAALANKSATVAREASGRKPSGDRLADLVREAVERGDTTLGQNLGDRAVPYLEAMITADLESFPSFESDPLQHLVTINTSRASELVLRTIDAGGPVWKARILRAMGRAQVLTSAGPYWRFARDGADGRILALTPRWIDVVERLVADPTTLRDAMQYVDRIATNDGITPGLQKALVAALLDPATSDVANLANAVSAGMGWPSVDAVMRGALASPNAEVRLRAIGVLCNSKDQTALFEAAKHSDPRVRESVAACLVSRYVTLRRASNPSETTRQAFTAPLDEATRATLVALARDPVPTVRAAAAQSIAGSKQPLEAELYELLARDPDSKVRASVLSADALPAEQRARLARDLASDGDSQVLSRVDVLLRDFMNQAPKDASLGDEWLEVLRARRANPVDPIDGPNTSSVLQLFFQRDVGSPKEHAMLAEWALAGHSSDALSALVRRLDRASSRSQGQDTLLDDATWARVLRAADADPRNAQYILPAFHRSLTRLPRDRSAEFLPLATDATLQLSTRCYAASIAHGADGARMADTILALMTAAGAPENGPMTSETLGALRSAASVLDEANGRRLVEQLMQLDLGRNDLVVNVLVEILARVDPTPELGARMLERWLDDGSVDRNNLLVKPLSVVGRLPRERQGDWLLRAARVKPLARRAFDLIGDSRDDSYVPFLKEALSGELSYVETSYEEAAEDMKSLALNALTRYFDARAASIILEVAGTTRSATLRNDCFKALETIRAYEAEKGRLAQDQTDREAVRAAVRELAGLLSDADPLVRLRAVKGLAALGAREQMPAIVKMLKDADKDVRAGASAALDQLGAPQPAPPATQPPR